MARIPPINRRPFTSLKSRPSAPHPRTRAATSLIDRARILRADPTPAESALWSALSELHGFHFRRQARIGPYIADLACKGSKLIVELDGARHGDDDASAYDERRTAYLQSRGYRVLRFWNHEVLQNRSGVMDTILRALGR